MNKAKMTFRFDETGRKIEPRHPSVGYVSNQEEKEELEIRTSGPIQGKESEVAPLRQTSQYRAIEVVEEWGDPFTDYTGTGLTVFPESPRTSKPKLELVSSSEHLGKDQSTDTEPLEEHEYWIDDMSYTGYITAPNDRAVLADGPLISTDDHSEHYYRPTRTSWWKVAGSLTGAIITGALFGFVVLSMFNQEIKLPLPGIGVPKQSNVGEAASVPVMGEIGDEQTSEELLPQVNFALPTQTYYFLQYGVFSTAQGVQQAQEELQASGIAAARDTVDEKRVYAGVSTDREQAKLLSGQLKAAGVHLILHEINLPASAAIKFNGEAQTLETYLAQSAELVSLLSSKSASLLSDTNTQQVSSDELKELGQKHQLWTESASAVRGKWSSAKDDAANVMEKAINGALEAMNEFNKSGAKTLLWEVQNEMMRFIMAEQALLNSER
ncbi:SPOR domain-containing protein [Paenibacillus puldeungensis]|uniref:SPOR domain-containing protein n=1 Tax=Paenibacillus puldeungensis TaxID=696536 RepID=A0ABW3S1U7_9BACL